VGERKEGERNEFEKSENASVKGPKQRPIREKIIASGNHWRDGRGAEGTKGRRKGESTINKKNTKRRE